MVEHLMPEPPDGAMVLVGEPPVQVVLTRDDASSVAARDQQPSGHGGWDWSHIPDDARWWLVHDECGPPFAWNELIGDDAPPHDDYLPVPLNRREITRLYVQAELDAAVKAAQVTPVGEHLIESGGYCRTCTVHHSTPEIARIEDRLAEEARP